MSDMTMVERVARALCADNWRGVPDAPDQVLPIGYGPPQPWGPRWKLYEDTARVAIGAMREPTPAVLFGIVNSPGYEGEEEHALQDWHAAIDAALSDKQP